MKYVLKILIVSMGALVIFLWEILVILWSFRTHGIKQEWAYYCEIIAREYRLACRAFRY